MRIFGIWISMFFLSCVSRNYTVADVIVSQFEKGTDSIRWRRYEEGKKLVETITSYNDGKMKTVVVYDSFLKARPRRVHSYFIGRNYGHNFLFDAKGNIIYYSYCVGKEQFASYVRDYALGNVQEEGTILVDEIKNDKGGCTLFFVSAFHDKIQAELSSAKTSGHILKLHPSSLQPMLYETTVDLREDSLYYIKTIGEDRNTRLFQTYYDTLNVSHVNGILKVKLR